ncbi:hypothetical protein K7432_013573 [Basidiobolus ranarum]|uniref:Uncharacterized protein n=1 Tax=Basidiobolus ranarum TaxID=34480 RepID=A0ABR2WJ16_9FUNG
MSKRKSSRSKRYSSRSTNSAKSNRNSDHMELCTVERGIGSNTLNILVDNEIQYVLKSKRKLLSKNTHFYDASNRKLLYQAKGRGLLGYMSIKSQIYAIDMKFLRPKFSRGIYGFEVNGVDYFWDFEYASHLRCFTTHNMNLVAQYFWSSSLSPSPFHQGSGSSTELKLRHQPHQKRFEPLAHLVILRKGSDSPVARSIITFTGLLLLKNSIW